MRTLSILFAAAFLAVLLLAPGTGSAQPTTTNPLAALMNLVVGVAVRILLIAGVFLVARARSR